MPPNATRRPEHGPDDAISTRPVLVGDVMTAPVHTVEPHWTLSQAAEPMLRHGITALPVVNHHGELLGIITEADLMTERLAHDHTPGRTNVRDAMTRDVLTVPPTLDLESALARLIAGGRRALPVVNGRRVVGIITRRDIISLPGTTENAAGSACQSPTSLSRAHPADPPSGLRPASRPRTMPREVTTEPEPEQRWENEGGSLRPESPLRRGRTQPVQRPPSMRI